jgi:putative SOS response-associated peptidase YedK
MLSFMCGRFALCAPKSTVRDVFDASVDEIDFTARYNIGPLQMTPVIRQRANGQRVAHLLSWG